MKTAEKIQTTIKNMLEICKETAILFKDADVLMKSRGYPAFGGSGVGRRGSSSLENPHRWVTRYACRMYQARKSKSDYKAIGVFFVNQDNEPIVPRIAFANLRITSKKKKENMDSAILRRVVNQRTDSSDLGVWENVVGEKGNFRFSGRIQEIELSEVQGPQDLESKVVAPLTK